MLFTGCCLLIAFFSCFVLCSSRSIVARVCNFYLNVYTMAHTASLILTLTCGANSKAYGRQNMQVSCIYTRCIVPSLLLAGLDSKLQANYMETLELKCQFSHFVLSALLSGPTLLLRCICWCKLSTRQA